MFRKADALIDTTEEIINELAQKYQREHEKIDREAAQRHAQVETKHEAELNQFRRALDFNQLERALANNAWKDAVADYDKMLALSRQQGG